MLQNRELPRVWKRFWSMNFAERFTVPGARIPGLRLELCRIFQKENWFSAVTSFGDRERIFVAPWTKVRTLEFVRDAIPGGKSSKGLQWSGRMTVTGCDAMDRPRGWDSALRDDGRTGPSA